MATMRSQRTYDHRLVQDAGDASVATRLGVPRSTAAGWLRRAPHLVTTAAGLDVASPDLLARLARGPHAIWGPRAASTLAADLSLPRVRTDELRCRRSGGYSAATVEAPAPVDWREHISVDPAVCHGQACVAGTRMLVSVVLDNLAAGHAPEEIVAEYPPLTLEDVRACIAYAAELAHDRTVALPFE